MELTQNSTVLPLGNLVDGLPGALHLYRQEASDSWCQGPKVLRCLLLLVFNRSLTHSIDGTRLGNPFIHQFFVLNNKIKHKSNNHHI